MAILALSGLVLCFSIIPAVGAADSSSFVQNGDFEKKEAGWRFVTGKGVQGGKIVEEPDGNHALYAEGETYWMAATDYREFVKIPATKFAGKRLRLTFRAKGDKDAYPGFTAPCFGDFDGARVRHKTLHWRSKYPSKRVCLEEEYRVYSVVREIPEGTTTIGGLTLYNCTRRGRLWIDDIRILFVDPSKLMPPKPAEADAAGAWEATELGEKELIEVSNTHNYLVTEWAHLYGHLNELERAAHYLGDSAGSEQTARVAALRSETERLWTTLQALGTFYTARFKEKFGHLYTDTRPWGFYLRDEFAGRDLLLSVGASRSKRTPFVELERAFAEAREKAEALRKAFRATAVTRGPDRAPPARRKLAPIAVGERPFDERWFPKRVLIGPRLTHYGWHAGRWLDSDFIFTSVLAPWEFGPGGELKPNYELYRRQIEHYDLRWMMSCFMEPQIACSQHRPSFLDALAKDPAMRPHTERGAAPFDRKKDRYVKVNVLHPRVQDYAQDVYEQIGRLYEKDLRVMFFEYEGEPTTAARIDGQLSPYGHSKAARKSFSAWLQKKFESVENLNRLWGSSYRAFDQVEPPECRVIQEKLSKHLPLICESQKFRKWAQTDHFVRVYRAYRKGGPRAAPVACRFARGYLNGHFYDSMDTFRVAAETMDIFCTHDCAEGSARHRANLVYDRDIAAYANKPRGSFEFYPLNPDGSRFNRSNGNSLTLFNRGMNSFWRLLHWEVNVICPWMQNSTGGRDGLGVWSPTYRSGQTLIHESSGILPLIKKQAGEVEDVLLNTTVARPPVAMLAPYDASIVGWPDGQVQIEGVAIHRFLDARNYDYRYVPEELVVSGRESLADLKVLFAPYVLWASGPLQEKVTEWVARGGILVSLGPFGLWDEYGRSSRVLIDKTFGNIPIETRRAGVYAVSYPHEGLARRKGVTVETLIPYTDKKQPNLIRADFGRGRAYLTADTSMDGLLSQSKEVIYRALDDAIGLRNAWCANRQLELVTRQTKDGADRYLMALNRSIERPCDETIVVKGEYPNVWDLSIGGGFPVKAKAFAGVTVFTTHLGPGEGTCISLGRYRPVQAPKAQQQAFIKAETSGMEQRVQETLRKISAKTRRTAFAGAMTCRNAALALQSQGRSAEALEFAQRAVQLAASDTEAPDQHPVFTSLRATFPPSLDNDAATWADVAWMPMGTGRFKSMWNKEFLYFLVEVKDAEVRNDSRPPRLWDGDCVEIYLDVLGQGGNRKHGPLDYQFIVAPAGRVQVQNKAPLTRTRAAGKRTPDGYLIQAAIAHDDTCLAPTPGYALAFNLRQLDFSVNKEGRRVSSDQMLMRTGQHPASNVSGWPKLALQERKAGPASAGKAEYVVAKKTIRVSGLGNTLRTIADQVDRPSVARFEGQTMILGADLHLAKGAELILGDVVVAKSDALKRCALSADRGSRVHLVGDSIVKGVLAVDGLQGCELSSETRNRLTIRKRVLIRLTDKQGRAVRLANIGVKVVESGKADVVLDTTRRTDAHGVLSIELPAAVFDVTLLNSTFQEKRYDLTLDDTAVTAVYPLPGVRPLAQDAYDLTCHIHR